MSASCALTIKDGINGSLAATGEATGAGIGGSDGGSGGTITITGGNVTATSALAAGIGGGALGGGGTITITGGNVTAISARDAGIGGGYMGSGGNISITDGTVIAHGSANYDEADGGAGIGGGSGGGGDAGTINISGGIVNADGGLGGGAGIGGGGYGATGGTITISGGTVTAAGGTYAYGAANPCDIGKGIYGVPAYTDKITITGGSLRPMNDKVSPRPKNGTEDVYLNILTLSRNQPIDKGKRIIMSVLDGVRNGYRVNDVFTGDGGNVYFWLTERDDGKGYVEVVTEALERYGKTFTREGSDTNTSDVTAILPFLGMFSFGSSSSCAAGAAGGMAIVGAAAAIVARRVKRRARRS